MDKRKALVTGIGGQDGSYLCEILLQNGYTVHGIIRNRTTSDYTTVAVSHVLAAAEKNQNKLVLHSGDIMDPYFLLSLFREHSFDEVYHLAAQSHVGTSFKLQLYTCDVNALGTLRLIQTILTLGLEKKTKFYNACSSETFGQTVKDYQDESTPLCPVSPYAAAKAFSYWITSSARITHGLFAVNGILFNHESPRRGLGFVTRKITFAIAQIHLGLRSCIMLGNLNARRDWGHARDYMQGAYSMMKQDAPDDYVLATGKTRSVRDFVVTAFQIVGIRLEWSGSGIDEVGVDARTGQVRVRVDPDLYRPAEVSYLRGSAQKAATSLDWKPEISFKELVKEMVEADIALIHEKPTRFWMESKL
ncbi:putative GDP-D-mannose dehydratase [Aspergillus ruber CBS 135680]|uniref:GDP-mannose 4,6-dehydratase n=1 Tax=Aspergillus ruber (strain CBS 135680) TaxID=1388766 RepID=A0A017S2J0_ASPRC|nr:NAD(P)-binding protein [Aspergillus ruber CBS 135680]EYE91258.1 NAD(P)-binding protein [Aspergillus ruber CBS 135680]